jgi:hypothetical protein
MPRRRVTRTAFVLAALSLYAALLAGNPLLHHDLACHVKSTTHCDACVTSAVASRVEAGARVDLDMRRPSGAIERGAPAPSAHRALPAAPGRAPPA